ncbi:MAG: protein kinase [Anaerolineae bacterium]|nr:protein kinase [Anaerolineae bacterium]
MILPEGAILENRYRIDQMLAQGGMGAIYQGYDQNLKIMVAIKENFFQTPQSRRQFEQEALILARLNHPGLPRVIDHFSAANLQYLVMDFVAGQDLWQMVKQQGHPFPEAQAVRYISQVCEAVAYLHRQNPPVIHRDIKPQNIKVTPKDQAILVDFGIAKIVEADSRTRTGARGITPGFSPPEQYTGQGTTHASDIYALGATLYALLTGKKPPDSIGLMTGKVRFELPNTINPNLSRQVSEAIRHAMQIEQAQRPQSVVAWQQELESRLPPSNEPIAIENMPVAMWLIGPNGQNYQLQPGSVILGRSKDNDIPLSDPAASRRHAMLEFDGQHCFVYDEGSANGTFINDRRVNDEGHPFHPGDNLRIGQTTFTLSTTPTGPGEPVAGPPLIVDDRAETAHIGVKVVDADPTTSAAGRQPVAKLTNQAQATMAPPPEATFAQTGPTRSKQGISLLVIGLIVVGVVVIGGVVSFLITSRMTESKQKNVTIAEETLTKIEATPTSQPSPASNIEATTTATWLDEDDDRDGLLNREEVEFGTQPNAKDSDQDGLNDADEIRIHQTNPLNPDTDGDSLKDGIEVNQGLNPMDGDTDGDGLFDASDPNPAQAPTATVLPTNTPSPTLLPSATLPPANLPTATPQPVTQTSGAAPPGIFQDFESQNTWERGDQPYGEFYRSSTQTHSGNFAGQLDYNFPSSTDNDFVVFSQRWTLSGNPNAISAWVYGDGAGHFLNAWIKDAAGQIWGMSFGQVKHTGWQEMIAYLDSNQPWPSGHISGPDNGVIDYPISFQALVLDDGVDTFSGSGTLYIDNLASVSDATAPTPTPAPVVSGGAQGSGPAIVSNNDYTLKIGNKEFNYVEPWGSPVSGDVCHALKYNEWDDTQGIYSRLQLELILINNTQQAVADDWGGIEFITDSGYQDFFCRYEYAGSGPPPGESRSITLFGLMPINDRVQYIRLNNLPGQAIELCITHNGKGC